MQQMNDVGKCGGDAVEWVASLGGVMVADMERALLCSRAAAHAAMTGEAVMSPGGETLCEAVVQIIDKIRSE